MAWIVENGSFLQGLLLDVLYPALSLTIPPTCDFIQNAPPLLSTASPERDTDPFTLYY